MDSVKAFLEMGGYAAFVWPAYAVAFVVLVGLLAASLRGLRRREAELAALQQRRNAAPPRPAASVEPGAGRGLRA